MLPSCMLQVADDWLTIQWPKVNHMKSIGLVPWSMPLTNQRIAAAVATQVRLLLRVVSSECRSHNMLLTNQRVAGAVASRCNLSRV